VFVERPAQVVCQHDSQRAPMPKPGQWRNPAQQMRAASRPAKMAAKRQGNAAAQSGSRITTAPRQHDGERRLEVQQQGRTGPPSVRCKAPDPNNTPARSSAARPTCHHEGSRRHMPATKRVLSHKPAIFPRSAQRNERRLRHTTRARPPTNTCPRCPGLKALNERCREPERERPRATPTRAPRSSGLCGEARGHGSSMPRIINPRRGVANHTATVIGYAGV